jgi:RNA polymerase sigma-70 factor (ECF subfamily)
MPSDSLTQPQPEADENRLKKLKAGCPATWREILSQYGPQLLSYATRMLGDKGAAEEVLQDSLVNIYRNIESFDGRCSIKSWMYRAVHNSAIDEIRRRKRYVEMGSDPEQSFFTADGKWQEDYPGLYGGVSKHFDDKRMLEVVSEEINQLPHTLRDALLLKEVEGLDKEEICATLGINEGNLRIRVHRARAALRAVVMKKMKAN